MNAAASLAVVFALGVLTHDSTANASIWGHDWKDGCPPYFDPASLRTRDLPIPSPAARTTHHKARPPTRGNARSFGINPDIDSSLGPTRFEYSLSRVDYVDAEYFQVHRMIAHVNAAAGPTLTVSYAGSYRGTDELQSFRQLGNLQAYVGLRRAGYLLGGAVRFGGAIRFGGGSSLTAESDPHDEQVRRSIVELNNLASLSPFQTQLFGFDRPLTLTTEARFELIGCHAPFVHLRLEGTMWRSQELAVDGIHTEHPRVLAVPLSLAFGGYLTPMIGVSFHTGWEIRTEDRVLGDADITRVGLLLEMRLPFQRAAHLTGRFDAITSGLTGFDVIVGVKVGLPHPMGGIE